MIEVPVHLAKRYPFYARACSEVPDFKDPAGNLAWRKKVFLQARRDRGLQASIKRMCSEDLLFYVNLTGVLYEARPKGRVLPFVTWDYQDETFFKLDECLGYEDVIIEKSRDMGASWQCIYVTEHPWHFEDLQSFLYVSRKESLVDKTDDPKSLFWKLDLIHKYQARWCPWLLPKGRDLGSQDPNRMKLHLKNGDTGSVIDGETTTGDVGRGDRRRAILLDEFAAVPDGYRVLSATRDTTDCRLFNSTPEGSGNAFYEQAKNPDILKIRMHWFEDHPLKLRGATFSDKPAHANAGYRNRRGYVMTPWYLRQCKRAASPVEIASQCDIDYTGSGGQFFATELIDRIKSTTVCDPYVRGTLTFRDDDTCEPLKFTEDPEGELLLWCYPPADGPLRDRQYCAGADLGTGKGAKASNSVLSVGDRRTGEKVAEWATCHSPPHKFARIAVALCKWFRGMDSDGAYLIWESDGPGEYFGQTVWELGYRNVYFREQEASTLKKQRDQLGWKNSVLTGPVALGRYSAALDSGDFITRHLETCKELPHYQHKKTGAVVHSQSETVQDPTGSMVNHGDRVISEAVLWVGMQQVMPVGETDKERNERIPVASFAGRRQRWRQARAKTEEELVGW